MQLYFNKVATLFLCNRKYHAQHTPAFLLDWIKPSSDPSKNTSSCKKTWLFCGETSHFGAGGKRNFSQVKAEVFSDPGSFLKVVGFGVFCLVGFGFFNINSSSL